MLLSVSGYLHNKQVLSITFEFPFASGRIQIPLKTLELSFDCLLDNPTGKPPWQSSAWFPRYAVHNAGTMKKQMWVD
jgi:hypothetical protein